MQNGETAIARYETAPKMGTLTNVSAACLNHLKLHLLACQFTSGLCNLNKNTRTISHRIGEHILLLDIMLQTSYNMHFFRPSNYCSFKFFFRYRVQQYDIREHDVFCKHTLIATLPSKFANPVQDHRTQDQNNFLQNK